MQKHAKQLKDHWQPPMRSNQALPPSRRRRVPRIAPPMKWPEAIYPGITWGSNGISKRFQVSLFWHLQRQSNEKVIPKVECQTLIQSMHAMMHVFRMTWKLMQEIRQKPKKNFRRCVYTGMFQIFSEMFCIQPSGPLPSSNCPSLVGGVIERSATKGLL